MKNWGFNISNIEKTVRPQDDFYLFANGKWFKKNPIPANESRWGSFDVLRKKSVNALHVILLDSLNRKAAVGSNLQKVRDLYLSGMDQKSVGPAGLITLSEYFEMVNKVKSADDVVALSAQFRTTGINSLWGVGADQDLKDRKIVRLYIYQGGLGLPDRDYYLKSDKKSIAILKKYAEYIRNMHKLAGFKGSEIKKSTKIIMKIETALAKASMTRVELRNYEKQYNKMNLRGLGAISHAIDWNRYFKIIKASPILPVIVNQPLYVKEAGKLLESLSINDWKDYLKWKVLDSLAPYLGENMVRERFNFHGKILSGTNELKPRWERITAYVDSAMGEALGRLYIEKHFRPQAKKEINILVDNLISAYRERISALSWMSSSTKKKALEKLKSFQRKLGHPDKWLNYKKLAITPDSYLSNRLNSYQFEFFREIKKIGRKPDKKEWGMSPPTVNAYNNFLFNEVVFPAGIMQPPFFDPNADDAINYGAIGAVIGHELTHGFDDKGSTFDKNGEMKNWWSLKDRKRFEKKAQGLVNQYNKYEALKGVFVNGKLTIGENIADLGGLIIAYHAYQKAMKGKKQKILDGFTPEQRFFLGAAQAECGHARDAYLRLQINTDPHSPGRSRVNIPLSNMDEFYKAFDVKKGDRMWRLKKDRVAIW